METSVKLGHMGTALLRKKVVVAGEGLVTWISLPPPGLTVIRWQL